MHRTDRLFELVQILRDGRLHRAADLAVALGGVSLRTIWRDMATLIASGMPIEGERGVGYVLRAPTTLPPLMLTAAEMEALRAGLRQVAAGGDETLARGARSLAAKIGAVAPAPRPHDEDDLFAFSKAASTAAEAVLPVLRAAIRAGRELHLTCLDSADHAFDLTVTPLRLTRRGDRRVLQATASEDQARLELWLDRILAAEPVD